MKEILKERMDDVNFIFYQMKYNELVELKKNTNLWRSAMAIKNKSKQPFVKEIFNSIEDKYNYLEYYDKIKFDEEVIEMINNIEETNDYEIEEISYCIITYYTIETYIANMVEYVLYKLIKDNTDSKVYQNSWLDYTRKTDLMVNNNYYQIKNLSFITTNGVNEKLDKYKNYKELKFIFYTIKEDDVVFIKLNDEYYTPINKINENTFCAWSAVVEVPIDHFYYKII